MDETFLSSSDIEKIVAVKSLVYLYQRQNIDKLEETAKISTQLFNDFRKYHKSGKKEYLWLYCAALLHDIGMIEGHAKHHIHTQNIILDSKLLPFSPHEKQIISCIARYHRKALPSTDHANFSALSETDQKTVCILASFLRLAVELTRNAPYPIVDIKTKFAKDKIQIICLVNTLITKNEEPQIKRKDLLENIFDKKVTVKWKPTMLKV